MSRTETIAELARALGIPEPQGQQLAFLTKRFQLAKKQILRDMKKGIIPVRVRDYRDLSNYVIQPGDYGGFNTLRVEAIGARLFPPVTQMSGCLVHFRRAHLIVITWIDIWLRERSANQDYDYEK